MCHLNEIKLIKVLQGENLKEFSFFNADLEPITHKANEGSKLLSLQKKRLNE